MFKVLILSLFLSSTAIAANHRVIDRVTEDFNNEDPSVAYNRTVKALDYMIRVAERRLILKGHLPEAFEMRNEWESLYAPRLLQHKWELGDYPPLSEWLAEKYDQLEAILGTSVMKMTHLDDIKVVNFAVPVVFNPCDIRWDSDEYSLHFVPLAGVVAYWGAYGACMAGTCGTGTGLCSIARVATENIMVIYVAPPLSDKVYENRCEG